MRRSILVLVLILVFLCSGFARTEASSSNKNINKFTSEAIQAAVCDSVNICEDLDFKVKGETIYNLFLEKIGRLYVFSSKDDNNISGYLILTENSSGYEIQEIIIGLESPYIYKNYKNIYMGYGNYYEVKNDILLDTYNNGYYDYEYILEQHGANQTEIEMILATGVAQTIGFTVVNDFHEYYFESTEVNTSFTFPKLDQSDIADDSSISSYTNCGPVAGLSLVLFYEKYFPLSSPLTKVTRDVGTISETYYTYHMYDNPTNEAHVQQFHLIDVYEDLYVKMKTDTYFLFDSIPGTLHQFFLIGLTDYYSGKGYSVSTDILIGDPSGTATSSSSFDSSGTWDDYKVLIDQNIPVVIQLGSLGSPHYSYIRDISVDYDAYNRPGPYGSQFSIGEVTYESRAELFALHTVVAFGYLEMNYFDITPYGYKDTSTEVNERFAKFSTNYGSFGYIRSNSSSVSQAYGFSIY